MRYGFYRTNFGKPLLERKAQQRMLASKENLSDPVRRQVLEMLPLQHQDLVEDSTYLNIIDTFLFAGKKKRLVLLEYITEEMEFGTRFIEYYSFRKTLEGNILVYGWSYKSDAIRSYRLDRVVSATITRLPYESRYPIELFL